jgi:phosphoribosylformylglycinamidine cyclo-ligase
MNMTYAATGVNYEAMDPFKRMAIAAMMTASNIRRLEFRVCIESYGESAFLLEPIPGAYIGEYQLAHVEEGLGSKNLVADAMDVLTRPSYYNQIAQCTVAMIVNDLATLGALPLSVAMHLAVGDADWFRDERRAASLVSGWKDSCDKARCVWGGGETPTLKGIVNSGTALLSGSAIGLRNMGRNMSGMKISSGDRIVMVESSGIHANGLTLARAIAEKLPKGYLARLPGGRTYGETLLDPTHIYCGLVEDCFDAGVGIHYAVNITGHGWRKLMRATRPFTYVIDTLPPPLPIFDFLQEHGPLDDREAYGNLNMGAGFALYVADKDVLTVIETAKRLGLKAWDAGHIEAGDKKVVITPKDLVYAGDTLSVR